MDYIKCPECHAEANYGQHFRVFECEDCGRKYCYLCDNSGGGKKCPKCGCTDYNTVGKVVSKGK